MKSYVTGFLRVTTTIRGKGGKRTEREWKLQVGTFQSDGTPAVFGPGGAGGVVTCEWGTDGRGMPASTGMDGSDLVVLTLGRIGTAGRALVRLDPAGTPDSGFDDGSGTCNAWANTHGSVLTDESGGDYQTFMVVTDDGIIVWGTDLDGHPVLARYIK